MINENAENTIGARDFAADSNRKSDEIEANWWQFFYDYRLRKWQEELDELTEEAGMTFQDICRYLNITYAKGIGFYDKLPKKRTMYIGIGMALKQPLETINNWIVRYGMKKRLYVKDLEEDLPWIHLICANYRDRQSERNYYDSFEQCQEAAHETYLKCWEEGISGDQMTMLVETDLQNVPFDIGYSGLRQFVMLNMDSFKTAYVKPRTMLDQYVETIINAGRKLEGSDDYVSLNALRGYLDDSMINYLSGSIDTINVVDLKSGRQTLKFKKVPKSKRAHISLALALGMPRESIDRYLTMMGFASLDAVDIEEGLLLNVLSVWEKKHPLARRFAKAITSAEKPHFSEAEEKQAVQEMLNMRRNLKEMYRNAGRQFPYLKEEK